LLSAFFKRALPDPFPKLQAPPQHERAYPEHAEARGSAVPSRLALAASVAILVGSCWYVAGTRPDDASVRDDNAIPGGSARAHQALPLPNQVPAPPNPPARSAHPTHRGR
jgi:hypothetical protein